MADESVKTPLEDIRDLLKQANKARKDLPKQMKGAFVEASHQVFGVDFKENIKKAFGGIGAGIEGGVRKFADKADGVRKDVVGGLATIGKFVAAFVGLQAFLEGFTKAEEWFGANADWAEQISAGLANVAATFLGLEDEEAKKLASNISDFMDSLKSIVTSISAAAMTVWDFVFGDGINTSLSDLTSSFTNLGNVLWENKEVVAGIALLLMPGATIRTALWAIKSSVGLISGGFSLISTVASSILPIVTWMGKFTLATIKATLGLLSTGLGLVSSGLSSVGALVGGGAAAGAATIIGVVALVANTVNAFYNSIVAFKDTWAETGSFMESLNTAATEFIAQFIGWPVQLGADLINWVAGLAGFDQIIGDFDPVQGIRDFLGGVRLQFAKWDLEMWLAWMEVKAGFIGAWDWIKDTIGAFGTWIYNSETGAVFGIDWIKLKDDLLLNFLVAKQHVIDKFLSVAYWLYNPETGDIFGIDFKGLLEDVSTKIWNSAAGIPEKIGNMVGGLWNNISDTFSGWMNSIIDKANSWLPKSLKISKVDSGPDRSDGFDASRFNGEATLMAQRMPESQLSSHAPAMPSAEQIARIMNLMERNEELRRQLEQKGLTGAAAVAFSQQFIANNTYTGTPVKTQTATD